MHWWVGCIVFCGLVLEWFLTPIGLTAWPTATCHVVGIGHLLGFGRKLSSWVRDAGHKGRLFLGWGVTAYCANATRHMLGNIFVVILLSAPAATFWINSPYTSVEQVVFATITAFIGVPILIAVVKSGLVTPITKLRIN